jgi:hypothetical protein
MGVAAYIERQHRRLRRPIDWDEVPVPVKYSELPAIASMFRPRLQMGYAVRSGPSSHTGASMGALQGVTILLRVLLQSRAALAAEYLALRQQLAVIQRAVKRPRLHRRDRIFWIWLSRLWRGWQSSLLAVQPETVLRWHREGFRLYSYSADGISAEYGWS